MNTLIELNDLTPLVPTQSVESIYDSYFDLKFFETDYSNRYLPLELINYDGIFIKNCPNLQTIIDTFTEKSLVSFLNHQTSTLILKIHITDLYAINLQEIQKFIQKFEKKIFIISIENSSNENVQIYWKFQNYKIFWTQITEEISKFFINFLASSMRIDGHCGLAADFLSSLSDSTETIVEVDKLLLRNLNGLNLLMAATEQGDTNAVNLFIKSGFNVNEKVNETAAVDLAWNNQHFEIVLDLLKAGSDLPKNFDSDVATKEIKEFLEVKNPQKLSIFGIDDSINDCKRCGRHQIRMLIALAIAFPVFIWFSIRLKAPDVETIYSCKNLTDVQKLKILKSTVDFQGVNVIFGDLFGSTTSSCNSLSPQQLRDMLEVKNSKNPLLKIHKKVKIQNKFYIERTIKTSNSSSSSQSEVYSNFNNFTDTKLLLLSDKGGSGKSTYFRHMAWKLKQQFPLKWISYVDLKQHIHALQDVPKSDANLTTIVDFMSLKLLNLTSKIEIEVFKRKFMEDDAIFLWDAVDEINLSNNSSLGKYNSNSSKENMVNKELSFIKCISELTDNRQFIASKPHLNNIFRSEFNATFLKFENLNFQEEGNFIEKFWDSKGIEVGNITILALDVEKFSKNLQSEINIKSKIMDFSENLQFFNAICEAYVKNLTLLSSSVSLYEVYDFYVQKTYEDSLVEDEFEEKNQENLIQDDQKSTKTLQIFRKIHQHFAIASKFFIKTLNIFTGENDINCKNLEICQPLLNINNNQILKFGLIYQKDDEMFFEHLILKDYFAAQYFISNIWEGKAKNLSNLEANQRLLFLFYVINECQEEFKIVNDFILEYISSHSLPSSSTFSQPIRHIMLTEYRDLLAILGDVSSKIDIATKFFKKDRKVIETLWKINQNRSFFHEFFEKLTLADDVVQMKKIVDENFNLEDRKIILEGKHQAANFLRIAWQKRTNKNSTIAFMDAVNFQSDIENLRKIKSFSKFMEFLESENFSREELIEFFKASLGTRAVRTDKDAEVFIQYAKKLLSKDDYAELSINWDPYEV